MSVVAEREDHDRSVSHRQFALGLALIAAIALAIRVGAAIWYDANTAIGGDAVWYSTVGRFLAEGKGFIAPFGEVAFGRRIPSAAHPPLYPVWLSFVGHVDDGTLAQRLWSTLPGVGTVVMLGLLTRDVVGERAGLIAAGLGAVSISLVAQDVNLWSEGMFAFTIVLTVYFAYRFIAQPSLLRAGFLSGAIAFASLTRAEGALLFVILLVPLALRARELAMARRIACIAVGAIVAGLIFSPWVVYNNRGRFESPVFLSTGLGGLVGSSNCPRTYSGPGIGGWGGVCAEGVTVTIEEDETRQDQELLDAGIEYARSNADRLAVVVPVRLLRSFGFWEPVDMTANDLQLQGDNARLGAWAAMLQYWAYLGFGVAGLVVLRRRGIALLPFVTPVVTVAVITVLGYGTMRFRIALDAVLPALAAVAVAAWWRSRSDAGAGTVTADS
jgi:hypothetical protein